MRHLDKLIVSVASYMLAGYLLGLTIGFTLFDPNLDIYALLGLVLAVIGALIGLLPFFRRHANIVFGALIGFYLGAVITVLLLGNASHDDLINILQRGGLGMVLALVGALLGGIVGSRLPVQRMGFPALGLLIGGFVGGYLFGFVFRLTSSTKMIGIAPFVIGSGILTASLIGYIQGRVRNRPAGDTQR